MDLGFQFLHHCGYRFPIVFKSRRECLQVLKGLLDSVTRSK